MKLKLVVLALSIVMLLALGSSYTSGYDKEKDGVQLTYEIEGVGDAQYTPQCISQCMLPLKVTYAESPTNVGDVPDSYMLLDVLKTYFTKDAKLDDISISSIKLLKWKEVTDARIDMSQKGECDPAYIDFGKLMTEKHYDIEYDDTETGEHKICAIDNVDVLSTRLVPEWVEVNDKTQIYKGQTFNILVEGKRSVSLGYKSSDIVLEIAGMNTTEYAWWDSNWLYYQPINVSAAATSKKDYAVNVLLNSANVGTNWAWATDCNGVRFVDAGDNELDYYRENCSASSASFWVEVKDNITSAGNEIRMFYGNAVAATASNGTRTFLAFDDFEDNSVSDWTASGGTALAINDSSGVAGSYCMQITHSGSYQGGGIKDVKNFAAAGENDSVQIHYLAYPETAGTKEMGYYIGSSEVAYSGAGLYMDNGGATGWWTANGNQLTSSLSAKWYVIRELVNFAAKTFTVYIDGALEVSDEGLRDSGSITKLNRFNKLDGESGAVYYLDNEWVSKYQSQEPVYTIGSEVTQGVVAGTISIKSPKPLPYVYHNGTIWFNATTSNGTSWCYAELDAYNFTMTNSSGKWHYLNATIRSGSRAVKYWCNISNVVVTASRNFTLNYPYAHLQSPSNITYFSKTVSFNISYSSIVSTVSVELSGHNFSLVNSTGKWWYRNASMSNGNHTAVFWANDAQGNVNKTSVFFTVNAFPDVHWWNSDWPYDQQIIVSASKTTKRGYVMNVLLNPSNVGGNWNWSRDCNGVRFIDVNNSQLNYYRENCSASYASFWVKVNENITTSGSFIRMFYGNAAAATASNGTNTFLAFDDFEDGDVSDWSVNSGTALAANASNGVSGDYCMQIVLSSSYGGGGYKDVNNFVAAGENNTVQIHFLAFAHTAGSREMGYYVGSSEVAYSGAELYMDDGGLTGWWGGGSQLTDSLSKKWYIIKELVNFTSKKYTVYIDGVLELNDANLRDGGSITKFNRLAKFDGTNGAVYYIDNMWVSKYQPQEPACVMGGESSVSSIVVQSPLASPYAYHNSSVWFNATASEAASWCFVELDSHNFTLTNVAGNWNYFNATMRSGGKSAKFWCNISGIVVSSLMNFTLNYPYAHLQSPSNTTYHAATLDFNITYSSPVANVAVELRGHNFTLVNSTGKWWFRNSSMSEGNFNAVFWANGTMGNANKTVIYFSISFPPKIVVISPLNNTSNLSSAFKINCTDAKDSSLTAKVYVNFTHLFRSGFLWIRTEPPSYGAYYATTKNLTNWTFNLVGEQTGEFHLVLMPYANQINNHTMIVVIRGQTNQKYVVSLDNGSTWSGYRILPNSGTPNTTYGLPSVAMMNNSQGVMMNWIPTNEGGGIEVTNITFNGTDLTKTHWFTFNSPRRVAGTPTFGAGFIERINDTWALMMFQEVMVSGSKIHLMSRLFNMKTGSLGNLYNISTVEAESPFRDYSVGRVHVMGDNGAVYLFSHSQCSGCGYGETQWRVMRHITNASSNYQSWSRDVAINGDPDMYLDYMGRFDVDENGNFYFIIGNVTSDLGWEKEELWLMTSSDKGRSFQKQNVIRRSGSYPSFAMGGEADQYFFNLTFGKGWSLQNTSIITGNTVVSLTPNTQLELDKWYKWYAVCTDSQGNSVSSGNYTFYYGTPPVTLSIGNVSVPSPIDPLENSTVHVSAFVNVTGGTFDAGNCTLYNPNGSIKNWELALETAINASFTELNCTFSMWYFNVNGTYNVTVRANNTNGDAVMSSATFAYNQLSAFVLNSTSLAFGSVPVSQSSVAVFNMTSTGNVPLNLQINGSDVSGISYGGIIGVSNMTVDDDSNMTDGTVLTYVFQSFTSLPVLGGKSGWVGITIPMATKQDSYSGKITLRDNP